MNEPTSLPNDRAKSLPSSRRFSTVAGGVGLGALVVGLCAALLSRGGIEHFLHSYLLGFVFVVRPFYVEGVIRILRRAGENPSKLGHIERGTQRVRFR